MRTARLLVASAAAAALATTAFLPPLLPNAWLEYDGVLTSAHRGGAFEAPENTLFAFREAMLRGADQLETDVALTADGEVVVIHDATVDRTTDMGTRDDLGGDPDPDVDTPVAALTLAELRTLDAAWCFEPGGYRDCDRPLPDDSYPYRGVRTGEVAPPPGYTPEWFAVPTLREVIDTFPGVPLNVEIKSSGDRQVDQDAARAVADVLAATGRTDDVVVVSFDDAIVAGFKTANQDANTAPGLVQGAAFVAAAQGPLVGLHEFAGIHRVLQLPRGLTELPGVPVPIDAASEDVVRDAHAANLAVHVFTVDDPAEMVEYARRGVDSIMTNEVALLEATLGGLAYRTPVELVPPCPAPDPGLFATGCNLEAFPRGTFVAPDQLADDEQDDRPGRGLGRDRGGR